MKIDRILTITILGLAIFAFLAISKPALAQTPPPASGIWKFFHRSRLIHVQVSWNERGIPKHIDYYTILRALK